VWRFRFEDDFDIDAALEAAESLPPVTQSGDLPGGAFDSSASRITPDGSVIVGMGTSSVGEEAFRWTSGGGMVGLGFLPGGDESRALDVSADGSVVIGSGNSNQAPEEAFRWTASDGMVSLGSLSMGGVQFQQRTRAYAMPADGNVIVGDSFVDPWFGYQPFLWTPDDGMRSLVDILTIDCGIDLTGWLLSDARDISADGRTIVGNGWDPAGNKMAWIATIPEPSSCALALLAGAFVLRRRHGRAQSGAGFGFPTV